MKFDWRGLIVPTLLVPLAVIAGGGWVVSFCIGVAAALGYWDPWPLLNKHEAAQ